MEKHLVSVEDIGNGRARLTYMLVSYRRIATATGHVRSLEPERTEQVIRTYRDDREMADWLRQCAMDRAKVGF